MTSESPLSDRFSRASARPWTAKHGATTVMIEGPDEWVCEIDASYESAQAAATAHADADLIVAAVNDYERLTDEVARLRQWVAAVLMMAAVGAFDADGISGITRTGRELLDGE